MLKSEFDQIVRENFDLSDTNTRRYIATLEDAGQEQLLAALSSALYDQIVSKVDEIDFGTIPLSRGDITKVQGFDKTEECLNIIRNLVIEYKQDPAIVDVVITSIANVKERKSLFVRGYSMNAEFPMLFYNLMVLSIERSVSLMIATCIQFVKDPDSSTTKQALDKVGYQKTMDDTLYKQLISFNNLCKNKVIDKLLQDTLKNPVRESVESSEDEFRFDPETMKFPEPDPVVEDPNKDTHDTAATLDANPFGPDSTEPFPASNEDPRTEDFPEELHDDDGNPVPSVSDPDDEELDIDVTDDQVEHIPGVTNGEIPDDIATSDRPITEDEFMQELGVGDILSGLASVESNKQKFKDTASKFSNVDLGKFKKYGVAGAIALAVITAPKWFPLIIGLLRDVIYNFVFAKAKFSDYLECQADFIDANANDVENGEGDLTPEKRKQVVEKQRRTADKLRKWANKFSLDKKQAENKAKAQAEEDKKKKRKVGKNEDDEDVLF